MNQLTRVLMLIFAALALAAAGCGGDDDEEGDRADFGGATGATGASSAFLSQDEFITAADAICKEGGDEVDQQANELFGGQQPTPAELEDFANDILVPNLREQAADIRALTPPEGDEDEINALLEELESAIDQVEQDPSLLRAAADAGPFAEANRLAQEYGFEECGSG